MTVSEKARFNENVCSFIITVNAIICIMRLQLFFVEVSPKQSFLNLSYFLCIRLNPCYLHATMETVFNLVVCIVRFTQL